MLTRRRFISSTLRNSSLLALAPSVPSFLAHTAQAAAPERDGRLLVVVQLDGGNDGINTVVPFRDEGYGKHRSTLRLPAGRLIKVNDDVGLHPEMGALTPLLEKGHLAVVQGVGYPNPSRSHFVSMAVWQTARLERDDHRGPGWLGRVFDTPGSAPEGGPASVYAGSGDLPAALRGRRAVAASVVARGSALPRPEDFLLDPKADPRPVAGGPEPPGELAAFVRRHALDGYAAADRMAEVLRATKESTPPYPGTQLAGSLRLIAGLIKLGVGTRLFYARQPGYDTHAAQFFQHSRLLGELAGGLKAFFDDLAAARLADRVAVLCFSEFGRTVKENGSAGTDHGTAGPVILAGPGVRGGLVGQAPSLTDLDPAHGDLRVGVDFRRVYATVIGRWLGLPAEDALGGAFEDLPLFRRA